ncbi:MAG: UDP-4-amino-4,6-dideoxy-N-acetyl-beta-L-altrosamine transaminase [Acidobacteriota bacterium]
MSSATSIPYSRQWIEDDDVDAVVKVLQSPYLTTGPLVDAFETTFARFAGTAHAVAVSSGTAALHVAMASLGLGPGDEVIVPCMTFVATANAAVYCGASPVFADVDPETLLVDPGCVERRITDRTRLIVGVDYAGQPCNYTRLTALARSCNAVVLADACHSLGSSENGRMAGSLADASVFSFHPVKPITSGEGGMITTNDAALADRMRKFRNHGIDRDFKERSQTGSWQYEMASLGFNYRLSDIHCALGLSQLEKCERRRKRREQIAGRYQEAFDGMSSIRLLSIRPGVTHAWHLFVVRIDFTALGRTRQEVFGELRRLGIGTNVHYLPVHLHRFYRERWSTRSGLCPNAEAAYEQILSLPIHAAMADGEVERVIAEVSRLLRN